MRIAPHNDARFTNLTSAGNAIDPNEKAIWNVIPASASAAYGHKTTAFRSGANGTGFGYLSDPRIYGVILSAHF